MLFQILTCGVKMQVMGRSSPNDKLLLVQALRKNGDVVAVTGDGTNDAPALHEVRITGDDTGYIRFCVPLPNLTYLFWLCVIGRHRSLYGYIRNRSC